MPKPTLWIVRNRDEDSSCDGLYRFGQGGLKGKPIWAWPSMARRYTTAQLADVLVQLDAAGVESFEIQRVEQT